MSKETYSKPTDVTSEKGRVFLDGPDGVDVAMTPDAAQETGDRLIDEAAKAAAEERPKKTGYWIRLERAKCCFEG